MTFFLLFPTLVESINIFISEYRGEGYFRVSNNTEFLEEIC